MLKATRTYISLWSHVWFHYRKNTTLLPHDAVLIKLLRPGKTLCYNSLGCRFKNHIDDLVIYEKMFDITPDLNQYSFDNVIVLNNNDLRYLTSDQLIDRYMSISNTLVSGGRLVVAFNSIWLLWNRLAWSLETEIDNLIHGMNQKNFKLTLRSVNPFQTTANNGDCLLIFTKL